MKPVIVTAQEAQTPRLRVRRVNEKAIAQAAWQRATEQKVPVIKANHGGSVANSYGFRAETETLVTVAFPDGRVVQWHGRANANKVSFAWAGDLFDGRCGEHRKLISRAEWLGRAYAVLQMEGVQHPRGRTPEAQVLADYFEAYGQHASF